MSLLRVCVLTIPPAQGDLYSYPTEVLRAIRDVVAKDMYVRLDGPSQIGLFVYDNDRFIVESFRESFTMVRIVTDKRIAKLRDFASGQELVGVPQGGSMIFETFLRPGAYRVFFAE